MHDFLKEQKVATSEWTLKAIDKDGRKSNNYHFQGDLEDLADAIDPEWQGPLPHTVLIATGSEILWRHTGEVEMQEVRNQVVDAMDTYSLRHKKARALQSQQLATALDRWCDHA